MLRGSVHASNGRARRDLFAHGVHSFPVSDVFDDRGTVDSLRQTEVRRLTVRQIDVVAAIHFICAAPF